MENTHSYDSQIAGKIDATLDGIKNGKEYSEIFLKGLLEDSLDLFENTHSDEYETYFKIEKYLKKN